MYRIDLYLGDCSNDGHGKTEIYKIESNLSLKDLQKAYRKGSKILGFDFITSVATDNEDNNLSKKRLEKLVSFGYVKPKGYKNNNVELDTDSYSDIILFICSLGNDLFCYNLYDEDYVEHFFVGGYGLFKN